MEVLRSLFGSGGSSSSSAAAATPDEMADASSAGVHPDLHPLNVSPVLLELLVPYLEVKSVGRMREVSKGFAETVDGKGPRTLAIVRQTLSRGHPGCGSVFERWGQNFAHLSLLRCPMADAATLPHFLSMTTRLRRLHLTDPEASTWDAAAITRAVLALSSLEELRLHCTDVLGYDQSPFSALLMALGGTEEEAAAAAAAAAPASAAACSAGGGSAASTGDQQQQQHWPPGVPGSSSSSSSSALQWGGGGGGGSGSVPPLSSRPACTSGSSTPPAPPTPRHHLSRLRKLSLFTRLDAEAAAALARFLGDRHKRSRCLVKLKLSTSLVSSPGGLEVLLALARHPALRKLTVLRPEGMGEPVRKSHCSAIAGVMVGCRTLASVHIRRAGMWTDTLSALTPARACPNITCLKLDSNSLAYLSSTFFNEAMDLMLSRLPSLQALHLGNNQLDSRQTQDLAASFQRHKVGALCSLTLGSNDIGDAGLGAILKALPPTMEQLYLHGTQITDEGCGVLRDALLRLPALWGLGLNGNPVSDAGVRTLCAGLLGRPALQDVGVTLSDMSDEGCKALGQALATCPSLRFVYLYSSGFKAATRVTDAGKEELKKWLPPFATPALDHRLSRYLKTRS